MADKMELYHIHKHNNYDKLWKPYREITVSENFKSIMSKRYNECPKCHFRKYSSSKNGQEKINKSNDNMKGRCMK